MFLLLFYTPTQAFTKKCLSIHFGTLLKEGTTEFFIFFVKKIQFF